MPLRRRPVAATAGRPHRDRPAGTDASGVASRTRPRRAGLATAVLVGGLLVLGGGDDDAVARGPSPRGVDVVPGIVVPDARAMAAASAAAAARAAGAAGSGAADRAAAWPLQVVAVGLRPIPLPRLVPRDTVGPLWLTPEDRAAGLVGLDVPASASGVLDVVPGTSPAPGAPGAAGVRTVRVEVERGLPVDGAVFAATVMATLNDPRGWGARGDVTFARTDGPADLRVVLASPVLVDALCAPLATGGEVSCGRNGHAALNFRRWALATAEFPDRSLYRQYLVNHEVGHLLGHPHERCPGPGRTAPLMQQQSVRVAPCVPNGWPYPAG